MGAVENTREKKRAVLRKKDLKFVNSFSNQACEQEQGGPWSVIAHLREVKVVPRGTDRFRGEKIPSVRLAAGSNVAAVHFDVDCGCFYVYYFNFREKKESGRNHVPTPRQVRNWRLRCE
jgi:hypothetical protein